MRRSPSSPPRRRLFWTLQLGGWLALVPGYIGINLMAGLTAHIAVVNGLSRQIIGFLITLVLWRIYRRWSLAQGSVLRYCALATAFSLTATLIDLGAFHVFYTAYHIDIHETLPNPVFLGSVLVRFGIYTGWSILYLSAKQFIEARDKSLEMARTEVAMRDAELLLLRSQLNPHFLFNALNSIVAEADDNPASVKAITRGLSDFLRFSLHQRDHFAEFKEELTAIENFLRVESSRFEERLSWRIEVPQSLRSERVPCSLLLPLVENAIKFGLQTSPGPLNLRIGAEQRDGVLTAFTENTGHWVEHDTGSTRIGLSNLRRRLELLCGPLAHVGISSPPGLVRVEVSIPLKQSAAA